MQCGVQSCVAEGQSLQNRTARCTAERNATYVTDTLCDVTARPPLTRLCENPLCQPVWNTSEWSVVSEPGTLLSSFVMSRLSIVALSLNVLRCQGDFILGT